MLLILGYVFIIGTSLVSQTLRSLPVTRETPVQSQGWEDPLEKEMATHTSIFAWKIQWMEKPGNGWRSLAGYSP